MMKTLDSVSEVFGEDQTVFVVLELTKLYESHFRGSVSSVIE